MVGGPKRGDAPFTSSFFGENPAEKVPSSAYGYKKYCYMPAIDFLEASNVTYKEDFENHSPLKEANNIKVVQISYSSIAAACNTSKINVMNCLKEIFSTFMGLIKQGNEVTLDLKIGTLNIMRDNVLMFRNYNPDVKINKHRNKSRDATSQMSSIPTSAATPLTNLNSTLSYRGPSQDFSALHVHNYGGIKRGGPAHEYNAELNYNEDERLYFRHKKNPYSYLDSFIKDERFSIHDKIKQMRMKERQKFLNNRSKHRRVLSSSLQGSKSILDNKYGTVNNTVREIPKVAAVDSAQILNKTAILEGIKGDDLNELEPSSVNDKIPSKFIIDYPNFLKPAKYYPYRRLEEHHISDVLQDARKRHEENLLKSKNDDMKYSDMFKKAVDDNQKVIYSIYLHVL